MAKRRDTGPTVIGENLRRLRGRASLTQEQLADKAGVSRLAVVDLESGRTQNPSATTISKLSLALGVPEAELWRRTESTTPVAATPLPASEEPRISLDDFLRLARGVLEDADVRRLQRLRTRLDPRGLTKRAWLRTVTDLREDDGDGEGVDGGS